MSNLKTLTSGLTAAALVAGIGFAYAQATNTEPAQTPSQSTARLSTVDDNPAGRHLDDAEFWQHHAEHDDCPEPDSPRARRAMRPSRWPASRHLKPTATEQTNLNTARAVFPKRLRALPCGGQEEWTGSRVTRFAPARCKARASQRWCWRSPRRSCGGSVRHSPRSGRTGCQRGASGAGDAAPCRLRLRRRADGRAPARRLGRGQRRSRAVGLRRDRQASHPPVRVRCPGSAAWRDARCCWATPPATTACRASVSAR